MLKMIMADALEMQRCILTNAALVLTISVFLGIVVKDLHAYAVCSRHSGCLVDLASFLQPGHFSQTMICFSHRKLNHASWESIYAFVAFQSICLCTTQILWHEAAQRCNSPLHAKIPM